MSSPSFPSIVLIKLPLESLKCNFILDSRLFVKKGAQDMTRVEEGRTPFLVPAVLCLHVVRLVILKA